MRNVVVDSCVLIDMFSKDRPRHDAAIRLGKKLGQDDVVALVPMHAFFEILTAMSSETRKLGRPSQSGEFKGTFPFRQEYVPIDQSFLDHYMFDPLPPRDALNVGAGDLVFLAIAWKRQCPLITEDQKLIKRAAAIGVAALDIEGYLSA
jgi:predicted nucleic acid-binding protein